jgi:hypothetical protein
MNAQATPDISSSSYGEKEAVDSVEDRLELILRLRRQAIDPLGPVAGVWAQSQLAHVDVPWLVETLQDVTAYARQLEQLAVTPCEGCGAGQGKAEVRRREPSPLDYPG